MPEYDIEPAPLQPQARDPHSILTGPLGLRAGWGLLLFFVLSIAFAVALFVGLFRATGQWNRVKAERKEAHAVAQQAKASGQPAPRREEGPLDVLLAESAEAGAVLLAALGLSYVEKRRYGVYGLPQNRIPDLAVGAGIGILAISLLIGILRAAGALRFDAQLLHGAAIARMGGAWLAVFLLVGVFEEFFFRGYIQFTLMRGLLRLGERVAPDHARGAAFWIASALWSLLFSVTHLGNAGEGAMGIVMVFVAGVLFSYALWRTGSLWWGIGFHMTWDWGQSFLYGVPDSGNLSAGRLFQTHPVGHTLLSGGTTGPEGSLLVLPVLLLVAVAIRMHPQAPQPPLEPFSLPLRSGGEAGVHVP